jgi:hypothetical protein
VSKPSSRAAIQRCGMCETQGQPIPQNQACKVTEVFER